MEGNLWQSIPGFPTIADVKAANISVSVCFNFFFSFVILVQARRGNLKWEDALARLVSVQAGCACSWTVTDVGGLCSLWAMQPWGWWSCKKTGCINWLAALLQASRSLLFPRWPCVMMECRIVSEINPSQDRFGYSVLSQREEPELRYMYFDHILSLPTTPLRHPQLHAFLFSLKNNN